MPLDLTIVKRHPAATAGVVVATIVIVYFATRNKVATGGSASPSMSSGLVTTAQGTDVAAQAYNAQIAVAQLGASVAADQTNAALAAQRDNNATAVALATITTGATTQQAQIVTDAATAQEAIDAGASTEIATTQANAAKDIATTVSNAQVAVAATNASAYTTRTSQINQLAATLAAGNKRSSTGVAQIISSVLGQGPQAIAANQPSEVASSPSAVIGAVANPLTKLLSAIF